MMSRKGPGACAKWMPEVEVPQQDFC
jgi:hypothetical protein